MRDRLFVATLVILPFVLAAGAAFATGAILPATGILGMIGAGVVGAGLGTTHSFARLLYGMSHKGRPTKLDNYFKATDAVIFKPAYLAQLSINRFSKAFNKVSKRFKEKSPEQKPDVGGPKP